MDLPLPVQSVPITTKVVSSNPAQARRIRYNIMWYRFSTTSARSVIYPGFFTNKTLPPPHNWNIVESGVKHHNLKFEYESSCLHTHCILISLHDIAEILLKVALNTMTLTLTHSWRNLRFIFTVTLTFTHSWRHLWLTFTHKTLIVPDIYDTYR